MEFIQLDIDSINKRFLINGNLSLILKNRRALYFFKDSLNGEFIDGESIAVHYKLDDDRELVLHQIQSALNEYKIQFIESSYIKDILNNYFQEIEDFRQFSQKAKAIWNNNIELNEFENFKISIQLYIKGRTLYPKQLLAAFHLAYSQNACNFSVPGAGKTSIVYAAYSYLRHLSKDNPKFVNKLLVIGPLSSFGPWEQEYFECFGVRANSIRLSGGVNIEVRKNHLMSIDTPENTPELTLITYDGIPNNIEELIHYLQKKDNKVMVVLDEAHKIKNSKDGIRAEAVLKLAKFCKSRIVLTGTPIPNGYEDIFNLYNFIWPNKEILNYNVYQLKEMSNNKYDERIDRLIENISPFFIRISKKDLDLPKVINHEPIYVEMGKLQREIYDYLENRYIPYFEELESNVEKANELKKAKFLRLMQVATNPNLLLKPLEKFNGENVLLDDSFLDNSDIFFKIRNYNNIEKVPSKFKTVKAKVSEILSKNEKVIIWGTFVNNIKYLQNYLSENNIPSEILIGEVPVDNDSLPDDTITREKIIINFHREDSPYKVLIANPFTVSESISLHKACHHAIYFERTFNASHFIQSKDRIHRVGLDKDIITHYHYILSKNSIDETIHNRLIEKELRMLELIESQEIPLFSENMNYEIDFENDVKAIIRDYVKRST